jgi:hypothetical protein
MIQRYDPLVSSVCDSVTAVIGSGDSGSCLHQPPAASCGPVPVMDRETVQNLGVITPHFETDDAPIAPRRRNPC